MSARTEIGGVHTVCELLAKSLSCGYPGGVVDAFSDGMAELCAGSIWNEVERARSEKPTQRTIRGQLTETRGLSQEQFGDLVAKTQSTISKWLSGGAGAMVWSNIVLAVTSLEVDFAGIKMPVLRARFRNGFRACLWHLKQNEFGEANVAKPSHEDIELLSVLYDPEWGWLRAKCTVDECKRGLELQRIADKVIAEVERRCGFVPGKRTAKDLVALERAWGACWQIAVSCIPMRKKAETEMRGGSCDE